MIFLRTPQLRHTLGSAAFGSPVSPQVQEALTRLDRLSHERPELQSAARLYSELIPVLFGHASPINLLTKSAAALAEMLARGVPLLRHAEFCFTDRSPEETWRELCDVTSRVVSRGSGQEVTDFAGMALIQPAAVVASILETGERAAAELSASGATAGSVASLVRLWALPRLAPLVAELAPVWSRSGWQHGWCPACGSWPLLAEFRGLEQFRWLRCGLCGSGWQVDRLFCPFCENRDHRTLQDFIVEVDASRSRLSVCDACHGFVRAVSTLAALSAPGLLVAELDTLHLQLVARDRGYTDSPIAE